MSAPGSLSQNPEADAPAGLLSPGTRIGGYTILRKLGAGGMAVVYLAHQDRLDRDVALKVLLPELASDSTCVARFEREASTAGGLSHPCIVPIYEIGRTDSLHYFSMEYVEGLRLDQYLRWRGQLSLPEGVQLMRRLLSALVVAHERKVIHRDIKPANIMLDLLGNVRVMDFGIATAREGVRHQDLTGTHATMGTPRYMAPEQCLGQRVDARTDLYTLAVVAWAWWAGRPPFDAPTPTALQLHHCQTPPPSLHHERPDLPAGLNALLLEMMAKNPDDRPPSATAVLERLDALPVPKRPVHLPIAAACDALAADAEASSGSYPPMDDLDPTPTFPPRGSTLGRTAGQASIELIMLSVFVLLVLTGLYQSAGQTLGTSLQGLDSVIASPTP